MKDLAQTLANTRLKGVNNVVKTADREVDVTERTQRSKNEEINNKKN